MIIPCLNSAVIGIVIIVVMLYRIARRSGVSDADVARSLPGDDLVTAPTLIMDRAAIFRVPARAVWPWIVQLGKGRAGWYCPRWLERFTGHTQLSGIRHIEIKYQRLEAGEDTSDYGPGNPVFRVMEVAPPHTLVYLTLRDPASNWTWPAQDKPPPDGTLALSWALVLQEIGPRKCRVYARVGAMRHGKPMAWWFFWFGGLVDWLTIALMFAGLRERVTKVVR